MMDPFTRADLRLLMTAESHPSVSIYMPTHRTGREIREDSLRCKNLLTAAQEQLQALGVRRPEARRMLEAAWELHNDEEFWRDQSDGLAIFATPNLFRAYRLPLALNETLTVNRRLEVTPLLQLLQNDGRFYILSVSQRRVRLFMATHYSLSELSPEKLPKNLQDALNIDEFIESLQFRGYTNMGVGAAGDKVANFHGHGGFDLGDKKREELTEFFRRIDDGLDDVFGMERTPLVFAGVDYLFPLFREASRYSGLLERPVSGNPDEIQDRDLHRKAWSVVEPVFHQAEEQALKRYGNSITAGLTLEDAREAVAAAREGRVDVLFLGRDRRLWGTIDEQSGEIELREGPGPGLLDLLDEAAIHTLLHGGTVFVVDPERVPGGKPAAAILRYRSYWAEESKAYAQPGE